MNDPEKPPVAEIVFKTISDLHSIPIEKVDLFCADLALWLKLYRTIESMPIKSNDTKPSEFHWLDDGKNDIEWRIRIIRSEAKP